MPQSAGNFCGSGARGAPGAALRISNIVFQMRRLGYNGPAQSASEGKDGPMKRLAPRRLMAAHILPAAACAVVCLAVLAAPLLAACGCRTAAAVLYLAFSGVCHQIPGRSFLLCGHPLAVCHRCAGVYLGMLLAAACARPLAMQSPGARRLRVLVAVAPLALDAVLERAGLWHGTGAVRFVTGFLFGAGTWPLLARGVTEWLEERRRRGAAVGDPHLKGGLP